MSFTSMLVGRQGKGDEERSRVLRVFLKPETHSQVHIVHTKASLVRIRNAVCVHPVTIDQPRKWGWMARKCLYPLRSMEGIANDRYTRIERISVVTSSRSTKMMDLFITEYCVTVAIQREGVR